MKSPRLHVPILAVRVATMMVGLAVLATINSVVRAGDCSSSSQDCCVEGTGPSCASAACCSSICKVDPYCCSTQWDGICATAARDTCDECRCGSGDCCAPHLGLGCDDPGCCEAVCASDGFCCEVEWDGGCALLARSICGACDFTCPLPPHNVVEQEDCLEERNGDCGGVGNQSISIGDSVLGCTWAMETEGGAALRDTDWYSLSVASATRVTLEVFSESLCFAAVARGSSCSSLLMVTESDPALGECPSSGSVCLAPGQYRIFVAPDAFTGVPFPQQPGTPSNEYVLRVSGEPCDANPPANDTCASAAAITLSDDGSGFPAALIPFSNRFAATNFSQATCGYSSEAFTADVYWTFRPQAGFGGDYLLSTCSEGDAAPFFDTGIEIWRGCPTVGGSPIACNDDGEQCNAQDGSDLQFASSLYANLPELSPSDPPYVIRVGGWSGAVGEASLLMQFVGARPSCDDPGALDCCVPHEAGQPFCSDESCCERVCGVDAFCCAITWDSVCVTYARAFCESCGGSGGSTGGGDECSAAAPVIVGSVVPLNSADASSEFAGPSCDGFTLGRDVYFSFVPPQTAVYSFDTCTGGNDAPFDTMIEIWSACPTSGGTLLACNDDSGASCTPLRSVLLTELQAGVPVLIRVGGIGTSAGSANLRVQEAPIGLSCVRPQVIGLGSTVFSRADATQDLALDGSCDLSAAGDDTIWNVIWFEYRAGRSGPCTVSTCNAADHDTRLAVLAGCSPSSVIACNDDAPGCSGFTSSLTFEAVCGSTYLIALGGFQASTSLGSGELTVSQDGPVCPPPVPGDLNGDAVVNGADLGILLTGWGGSGTGDLNGDGTIDGADLGILLTSWTP